MKIATLILFLLGACTLVPGLAAGPANAGMLPPSDMKNMKLGLWEGTIESQNTEQDIDPSTLNMGMQLTPEQKARMEAVLKRQHDQHVKNGYINKTAKTKRFCVKPGDFDKAFDLGELDRDKEMNCKTTEGPRSSSRMSFRAECKAPEGQFTWEMTYAVKSPTETYGEVVTKGTMMGKPQESSMKTVAHWVSADCGKVTKGPLGR